MDTLLQKSDILVQADSSTLLLSCAGFSRRFDLANGTLRTVGLSFRNQELASPEKSGQDFTFLSLNCASQERPYAIRSLKASWVPASFRSAAHAEVAIDMYDSYCDTEFLRTYYLFPGLPALGVTNAIQSQVLPNIYWSHRRTLGNGPDAAKSECCLDSVLLAQPANLHSVEFFGRTDYDDHRVEEHTSSQTMKGNLLYADAPDGSGLLFLQEAPPSNERRDFETYDFRADGNAIYSCCYGIPPEELSSTHLQTSYRHVLIAYSNPQEATRTLKAYLRARFPQTIEQSGQIVVNPWGCGKFPQLVSEQFLIDDITASAKAGADYYQIDDSWQKGKCLAALCVYNKHLQPDFWDISQEALHGTFAPICQAAAKAGIKPGLWLAPSSNCEYRDWEDTADIIYNMYKNYGFDLFKIDGVRTRTYEAQENLQNLLDSVREMSNGKIYFNLDTTNGQRPGYFQFVEYGNIFLENRYLCHLWGVGYHPEKTLQSLWQLTKTVRAQILQIEIPNPGDLNPEFYAKKRKPTDYPLEYWAAISLFACPLLWFTPSRASEETLATIKAFMDLHRQIWPELFETEIYPIGEEPSYGKAFTGFQAHNALTGHGFLLLFRECECEQSQASLRLQYPIDGADFQSIAPACCRQQPVPLAKDGMLLACLPEKASFSIWKY